MTEPTETETKPYSESDEHIPNSTDITGQLDTTGLGGPSKLHQVAPIVAETARRDAVEASETLKNGGLHSSGVQAVILPGDNNELIVDQDKRAAAEQLIHDRADEARKTGAQSPSEIQTDRFAAGAAPAGGDPVHPPEKTPTTKPTASGRRGSESGS